LEKKIKEIAEMLKSSKFIKYCFFGGLAAIIELASFFIINSFFEISYFIATPISFIIAATTNFILQRKFTFKNNYEKKHKQFIVFALIAIGGLIINWAATIAYVELFHLLPILAKFFAILTALIYNYTMNKKITFGKMK